MPGTTQGGLAAAKTLKQKYGDTFYAEIGRKGGSVIGTQGGFAHSKAWCNCDLIPGEHKRAGCAGTRGGLKSRRTGIANGEGKSHCSKM